MTPICIYSRDRINFIKKITMGKAIIIFAWVQENPEDPIDKGYWDLAYYCGLITPSHDLLHNAFKVSTNNPNFVIGNVWFDHYLTKFSNNGMYGTNTSGTIVTAETIVSTWKDALGVELLADLPQNTQLMIAIGREC